MSDIETRLATIEERNRRVELDKAWERSVTRRISVAAITYAVAAVFLWLIDGKDHFLIALVPTIGYLLSTLSLPWMKRMWMWKKK